MRAWLPFRILSFVSPDRLNPRFFMRLTVCRRRKELVSVSLGRCSTTITDRGDR